MDLLERSWSSRTTPTGERWPDYKDPTRTGGRLRHAGRRVAVSPKQMTLIGTFISAFHWYGTEFMPERNPTPFERVGGHINKKGVAVSGGGGYTVNPDWAERHALRLKRWLLGRGGDGR